MKIAAFTMAYNEKIFLPIWYNYYGKNFGFENIYLLDHGSTDDSTQIFLADKRIVIDRGEFDDVVRAAIVSEFQEKLLKIYDVVVFSDTDEILAPRSHLEKNLAEFISSNNDPVIRANGLNLVQIIDVEKDIDLGQPILAQRRYLQVAGMYSKTLITRVPVRWAPGFHSCSIGTAPHPDLLLIHLKNMDKVIAFDNQKKFRGLTVSDRSKQAGHARQFHLSPEQYISRSFGLSKKILDSSLEITKDLDLASPNEFKIRGNIFIIPQAYANLIQSHKKNTEASMAYELTENKVADLAQRYEWTLNTEKFSNEIAEGGVILSSSRKKPREFLTLEASYLMESRVTLIFDVKSVVGCTTLLCVEHDGGFGLCHLLPDYRRLACVRAESATLESESEGYRRLRVTWLNSQSKFRISITPLRGAVLPNDDTPQWHIRNVCIDVEATPPIVQVAQLVYVDIGARGGVAAHIARFGNRIHPVLVDADEVETAAVAAREKLWFSNVSAVPFGLADCDETRTLHVTQSAPCSSVLRPNTAVLNRYPRRDAFKTLKEVSVQCRRYESLFDEGFAPMPDYIKIDVQGFEYQVLKGFGRLLQNVIGIELECHVYALYEGQKLLGDLVEFLDGHDFSLRALQPQNVRSVFGGEVCEFNAWFLKRDHALPSSPHTAQKMELCRAITPRS